MSACLAVCLLFEIAVYVSVQVAVGRLRMVCRELEKADVIE